MTDVKRVPLTDEQIAALREQKKQSLEGKEKVCEFSVTWVKEQSDPDGSPVYGSVISGEASERCPAQITFTMNLLAHMANKLMNAVGKDVETIFDSKDMKSDADRSKMN